MTRVAVPPSLVSGPLTADVIMRDTTPSIRVTDAHGYLVGYFDTAAALDACGLTALITEIRQAGR